MGSNVVPYQFPGKPKDLWWVGSAGGYPLTRSLGANHIKAINKGIIATPQIKRVKIGDAEFLILGSDGLWDFLASNQEAVDKVNQAFQFGKSPQQAAETLANFARISKGSTDDIAVVVVKFMQKK